MRRNWTSHALAALSLTLAVAVPARAQGPLTNGENHAGSISAPGEVDDWTFAANTGDAIALSLAEVGPNGEFNPWLRLIAPDGSQLDSSGFFPLVNQINVLSAPQTGTYTVRVGSNDTGNDATGDYLLTLARTPGAFVVPSGDDGGAMTNGANHPGSIPRGDLDMWTFAANAGDAIALSLAEVGPNGEYNPWIRLRAPDGSQLDSAGIFPMVAQINILSAPQNGTYTVLVGTNDTGADAAGDYLLRLALTPGSFVVPSGDEGGPMTNGANHAGSIPRGDLDMWTFVANAGDAVALSLAEVGPDAEYNPWLRLRAPDGSQLDSAGALFPLVAQINVLSAPQTGTYTVLVGTNDTGADAIGDYVLRLALTPGSFVVPSGDEGGPMASGVNHPGTIDRGDLDLWTFYASQGVALTIVMAELPGSDAAFNPWIRLRGPTGTQVLSRSGPTTAQIDVDAPLSGLYTVVAGTSDTGTDATGVYQIRVNGAALPPTTVDDAYLTVVGVPLNIPGPGVLGNDAANGGGALTAQLVTTTAQGSLAMGADGGFNYTPNPGFIGVDSFTYRSLSVAGPGNVATVTITVSPLTALPPTSLYAASISGNLVTLRWTAPAAGLAPTGYVLEGGVNPGDVLASIGTGGTTPIFSFLAPTGAFYVRVHTLSGATRSAASNEIRIFVNVAAPPSAPANLVGLANGSSIALAWRNTFAGGAPGGVVLDVAGSLSASLPLGLTDTFQFNGVPGGNYTFSVRALNAAGSSPPSNAVALSFPSPTCSGAPLPPAAFLAYRVGNTLTVLWEPAASGPAPTSFVLNVSGAFSGSFGTPGRAVSGAVGPGSYTLSVAAVNACGSSTPTPPQVVVVP